MAMEPINPTRIMFDPTRKYPEEVYEAFEPIKEIYDLMTVLTEGVLADGPLTLLEVEAVLHANYVMSNFITNLREHGIVEPEKRDDDTHLNACVTALLAMKIRDREIYEATSDDYIKRCLQLLEYIVEDGRISKKETLVALSTLKAEVTKKIAIVRRRHIKPFNFLIPIPKYHRRKNKDESPPEFLKRVYSRFFARGLRPVHVRYEDENFYNTLHVWCSRNKIELNSLFVPERDQNGRLLTDKQRFLKKVREMPDPTSKRGRGAPNRLVRAKK